MSAVGTFFKVVVGVAVSATAALAAFLGPEGIKKLSETTLTNPMSGVSVPNGIKPTDIIKLIQDNREMFGFKYTSIQTGLEKLRFTPEDAGKVVSNLKEAQQLGTLIEENKGERLLRGAGAAALTGICSILLMSCGGEKNRAEQQATQRG